MKKTNIKEKIIEYIKSIAVALVIYLVISTTIIKATQIYSGSMEDTLLIGDFLFINKFIYGIKIPYTDISLPALREPKPRDIIVFKVYQSPISNDVKVTATPGYESVNYVKRCIAVAGQTVEIRNKVVYVDGKPLPDPKGVKFTSYVQPMGYNNPQIFPPGNGNGDNYGPIKVPPECIFMMGDNRDNSLDSRYWGFLPIKNIVGKPIITYWSWEKDVPLWDFFYKIRTIRWERIGRRPNWY